VKRGRCPSEQGEATRANEALNAASAEYQELVIERMSDIQRTKMDAQRRLALLGKERMPEDRGPVVRSTWQWMQGSPGPEDTAQETPPAFRPGSANVSDAPLLAPAGRSPETAVVPRKALERHRIGQEVRRAGVSGQM
jgi:hypothetical protein